ncbi:uncharacterized protein LOC135216917 [Macrobrachium nipponense]|uniref:uncharacterized protein LOC135216917 n=1 Tax=Macrobrachium nipponense TaxID=159736 RepID=UPI0030C876ED
MGASHIAPDNLFLFYFETKPRPATSLHDVKHHTTSSPFPSRDGSLRSRFASLGIKGLLHLAGAPDPRKCALITQQSTRSLSDSTNNSGIMNAKICALVFSFALTVVFTNAGRLQYVFHTGESFQPSIAGSQQVVHLVKRATSRSGGGARCPSFSASRCPHPDLPALCVGHRLMTPCHHVDLINVNI